MSAPVRGSRTIFWLMLMVAGGASLALAQDSTPWLVKDIRFGSAPSIPYALANLDGTLIFTAYTSAAGRELWRSDGTSGGTNMIGNYATLNNEDTYSNPYSYRFVEAGGKLYFTINNALPPEYDSPTTLWCTDGASEGTHSVKSFSPPNNGGLFVIPHLEYDGLLYFSVYSSWTTQSGYSEESELWRTDGTLQGTEMIETFPLGRIGYIAIYGSGILIAIENELWFTDGTTSGTRLVKSFSSVDSIWFYQVQSDLFLIATDLDGEDELWSSDGTTDGTNRIRIFSDRILLGVNLNGEFYFSVKTDNAGQLWKSDGTYEGTTLIKSISPGESVLGLSPLYVFGDRIYFATDDGVHGNELWVSDGTNAGTHLLKDIWPGSGSGIGEYSDYESASPDFTLAAGRIYFIASDGTHGQELWMTDGTADGTTMVADIVPGPGSMIFQQPLSTPGYTMAAPTSLTVSGGRLFFAAHDAAHGHELWALGVSTDSNPDPPSSSRLVRHLLGIEPLASSVFDDYDVNGDSRVDIGDAVRLINQAQ